MNSEATARVVEGLVQVCVDVFGTQRIEAMIQLGSSVKGGAISGYSDIDFHLYLAPDCFDERGELTHELVFSFQEHYSALAWEETGYAYPQVHFLDARRLPAEWIGPVPGSYRELVGKLPPSVLPTSDQMRTSSLRYLRDSLPRLISFNLHSFADTPAAGLPRRLRYLGTDVSPTVFSLVAHDAEEPLAIWALSKFEALDLLARRYPDADGPVLAQRFYDGVRKLYGERWDDALGRATFQTGIDFLLWAEGIGSNLPSDA